MHKTRKSIRKKTPEVVCRYDDEFQSAFTDFEYETESEQIYHSKKHRQSSLAKSIKLFRKSVEKYIQARTKIHNYALIR